MDEAIDDASTDKRAAWDKAKWERHEKQKGRCEKRAGAQDWHSLYVQYRAMDNPIVSIAKQYVFYPNNLVWAS
jgi:hypothetical protein